MSPLLVGVGMGPGDPELVTVKAVRVLESADLVIVPVMGDDVGRAEATVRAHVTHDRVRRLPFALSDRGGVTQARTQAWDEAGSAVAQAFAAGASAVAFATIGDPNVYSTFSYLAQTVTALVHDLEVQTVPGITAMQDLAARSGTVLCEGTESLALLPITAGLSAYEAALASFDTVVAYKGGRHLREVRHVLAATGRSEGAVFGSALGLAGEDIRPLADVPDDAAPYLSTVISPARRVSRGGSL
ncbi:precorrin-2/cobalt-factor-2 C20-methyltransferase [Motilibacter peucedani]|uniref:Precorrin-2/cobalt-factor-2 C20-methyltransferase n=1 Tax=Motilibacter peucedani TaxID=598650 RepID=A0A420XNK1_9ACTN|nr:precorrin-2 C(20)-methyltransferase [Motilibacter peucedani]RKS73783.1 precorrin-2/cobalt-factor-2 C20-methyltransferase [Motilibacter peucedani]